MLGWRLVYGVCLAFNLSSTTAYRWLYLRGRAPPLRDETWYRVFDTRAKVQVSAAPHVNRRLVGAPAMGGS